MVVDLIIWIWAMFATVSPIGQCDPVDGPKLKWTRAERTEARHLVQDTGRALGASHVFLMYLDSVTVRESHGAASRWHDHGTGLGAHGINIKTHAKRWPDDMNPAICDPRVSTMIVQDIAGDCIVRHGAFSVWDLQACFAGRFECVGNRQDICTGEQQDRTTSAICSRMKARGVSCYEQIGLSDLGIRVPYSERRAFAERVRASR